MGVTVAIVTFLLSLLLFNTGQSKGQESSNVVLFLEPDFKGDETERRVTSCINVPPNIEARIQSLQFKEGSCVTVYEECGCYGDKKTDIRGDAGDLRELTIRALSPCGPYTNFPEILVENWYMLIDTHDNEVVKRVYRQGDIAVYFDDKVQSGTNWMFNYLTRVWTYVKQNYGAFGEGEMGTLMAIFHAGVKSGYNQPLWYLHCRSGFRNGIHVQSQDKDAWSQRSASSRVPKRENEIHVVTHEIAHIVEFSSYKCEGSPAFRTWWDSMWAEIFQYDVYLSLGMRSLAQRWRRQVIGGRQDFPKEGTFWFRDWFLPIYERHGRSKVLARFFQLLSQNLPKRPIPYGFNYQRDLNLGDFVHFWSGAANKNLKDQATKAFGWTSKTNEQFEKARRDFPNVKYQN